MMVVSVTLSLAAGLFLWFEISIIVAMIILSVVIILITRTQSSATEPTVGGNGRQGRGVLSTRIS